MRQCGGAALRVAEAIVGELQRAVTDSDHRQKESDEYADHQRESATNCHVI